MDIWDGVDLPFVELDEETGVSVVIQSGDSYEDPPEDIKNIIEQLPEDVVETIATNSCVRYPISEARLIYVENNEFLVEGKEDLTGISKLTYLSRKNKPIFRKLANEKMDEFKKEAFQEDVSKGLPYFRLMRMLHPGRDRASKNLETTALGNSTYGKIAPFLSHVSSASCVGFGIASKKHRMWGFPGMRLCVDIKSSGVGMFKEGNLRDWRDFVKPGELIISDCSVADEVDLGMLVPDSYYGIYDEMCRSGHTVIFKADKLKYKGPVEHSYIYRSHNREIFVMRNKNTSATEVLDEEFLRERMSMGNQVRMEEFDHYQSYNYSGYVNMSVVRGLRKNVVNMEFKNLSTVDIIPRVKMRDRGCFHDPDWRDPGLRTYLDFKYELPAVLMDLGFMTTDAERLLATAFNKCIMEYDDVVGWVAMEYR